MPPFACARSMTREQAGAVAFSRTGDPDWGKFDPAIPSMCY
jgi:hypothetical protein